MKKKKSSSKKGCASFRVPGRVDPRSTLQKRKSVEKAVTPVWTIGGSAGTKSEHDWEEEHRDTVTVVDQLLVLVLSRQRLFVPDTVQGATLKSKEVCCIHTFVGGRAKKREEEPRLKLGSRATVRRQNTNSVAMAPLTQMQGQRRAALSSPRQREGRHTSTR